MQQTRQQNDMDQPHELTISGRLLTWKIVGTGLDRWLIVRSREGDFQVEARILDGPREDICTVDLVGVFGKEFPLDMVAEGVPFRIGAGTFEVVMHKTLYSEVVRSLVDRWCHGRRYRKRTPWDGSTHDQSIP